MNKKTQRKPHEMHEGDSSGSEKTIRKKTRINRSSRDVKIREVSKWQMVKKGRR